MHAASEMAFNGSSFNVIMGGGGRAGGGVWGRGIEDGAQRRVDRDARTCDDVVEI